MRQILLATTCGAILMAVLSLYLQPSFLMNLANQVWGCF